MAVWEEMAEFVACNDDDGGAGGGGVRTGTSHTDQTFTSKAWESEKFAQARVKVHSSFHMFPKPIPYHFIIPQFVPRPVSSLALLPS